VKDSDSLPITEIGFLLVIFGFVLVFAVMIAMAFKSASGGSGKGQSAGIILIGPIPIIFGSDKNSVKVLVVLAIVLIAVVLTFMLLPYFIGR